MIGTTTIIDNQQHRLADSVRDLLNDGANTAYFAVGYLFLEGLAPLCEQIKHLDEVEILMGNVVNRLTEEQLREEAETRRRGGEEWVRDQEDVAASLREAYDRIAVETALNLRRTLEEMPRTHEMRLLILMLAGRIAAGSLKVRLYTQGRLHAKLALIGYPPGHVAATGRAIVGSSNLTLGGPSHPTEMNILISDAESVASLRDWYHGLWESAQDFHRLLFDELGRCWALG